ncbi:hypothetical protein ACFSQE_10755 [Vogesella fluminis]|uniref:hypothetical protein n=1 Tax=Vogesella fluminis TaxID=1069161 RepID=UPI003636098F
MERAALAVLFLLVTVPFLCWIRYQPSGDYVSGVWAVLLATLLLLLRSAKSRYLEANGALLLMSLLPLLTMATALASPYPGQGLAASMGLLLCLALAHTVSRYPPQLVLTTLAWGCYWEGDTGAGRRAAGDAVGAAVAVAVAFLRQEQSG